MDCLSSLHTFANEIQPTLSSIREEKVKTAMARLIDNITASDAYLNQPERNIEARKCLLTIMADLSSYML